MDSNAIKEKLTNLGLSYWIPSVHEFLLFVCFIGIFIITVYLFHYNSIQVEVKKSRCFKMTDSSAMLGNYSVTAMNANNENMYKVNYDLDAKQTNLECACNPGNVVNTFNNIHIYDLQAQQDRNFDKICQCDKMLTGVDGSVYYSGYPAIIRYMRNGDTSFFDNKL